MCVCSHTWLISPVFHRERLFSVLKHSIMHGKSISCQNSKRTAGSGDGNGDGDYDGGDVILSNLS